MSDPSDKSKTGGESSLDLSSLQDLSFGPDWSDAARAAETRKPKSGGPGGGGKRPSRDRRPDRPPRRADAGGGERPRHEGRSGDDRRREGGGRRGERRDRGDRGSRRDGPPQPFKPIVDVAFYPEDAPFKALCHAMRTNCRTYELFEIARLILDKADRFVVVLHPKSGEGPQEFYISVPDGLPFSSEDQVIAHVIKNHLDRFVETEEIEVEPPSGNFPIINRCGVTGELIGPPNYHRYQALVHEHHAVKTPNMSFEKFQQRIESVRDEEVVQQWMDKMKKITRYKVKSATEGDDAEVFDSLESLKFYLIHRRRAEIVRTTNQARFSGKQAEELPAGPLRSSILGWREHQQRFPLETANNLRGRLRRMHFTIYKRGSKGASYVCAVKRKFRTPQTRLAESLQELIDFIEKHPNIEVSNLPEQFLGVEVKSKPLPEIPQEKAPDIEAVPEEEAAKIVEAHEQKRAAKQEGGEESESAAEASESTETAEVAKPEPKNAPAPNLKPVPEQLEDPGVRQMMFDLRWLVTEGYVTEFGDGRLFAPPPMEEAPKKDAAKEATPKSEKPEESPKETEAKIETAPAAAAAPVAEVSAEAESAPSTEEKPVENVEAPKAESAGESEPEEEATRTN
ncbi:MAG: hypothetical protein ACQKBV_03095 [Puniceicoccales bacterium]